MFIHICMLCWIFCSLAIPRNLAQHGGVQHILGDDVLLRASCHNVGLQRQHILEYRAEWDLYGRVGEYVLNVQKSNNP